MRSTARIAGMPGVKKVAVGGTAVIAGGFQWKYIGASLTTSYLNIPNLPGFKHSTQIGARAAFRFNWP